MLQEGPGTYEKGPSSKQEVARAEEVVTLSVEWRRRGREGRVLSV
jgi:hypothetical protein